MFFGLRFAPESGGGLAAPSYCDDDLAARIRHALTAPRLFLHRDKVLVALYETATSAQRIVHLRRMILLGLCMLNAYDVSGFVTTPHLWCLNASLRTLVMTPTALGVWYMVDKVDIRVREAMLALAMAGATAIPLLMFLLTKDPLGYLATTEIIMTIVYGNTTLALRPSWAIVTAGGTIAATLAVLCFKPEIGLGMSFAILLNLTTGTLFSLAANITIDYSDWRNYLLTLQETHRASRLTANNDTLTQLSTTDALTGLSNRRFLETRTPSLDRDIDNGRRVAVLMLDVDYFKLFNDRYGHRAGDDCLQTLSHCFKQGLSSSEDIVVRYGGEEFLLVLMDRTADEAAAFADEIRLRVVALQLAHESRIDGLGHVSISLGVATAGRSPVMSLSTLIDCADAALYMAKSRGRNRSELACDMNGASLLRGHRWGDSAASARTESAA